MRVFPRFIPLLLTAILSIGPLSAQTPIPPASSPSSVEALQLRLIEGESSEVPAGSRAFKGFLIEVVNSSGTAVPDAAVALRLPDVNPTGAFSDGTHSAVAYTDQTGRAKIAGIQWNTTPGIVAIRVTANKGTAHAGILIQQTLVPAGIGVVTHPLSQPATDVLPPTVSSLPLPSAPPIAKQPIAAAIAPGQPATPTLPLNSSPAVRDPEPAVSVTNGSTGASGHSSKTKWIILTVVAAGAVGAGVALMGKKSGSSSAAAPGISIGAPSISVGHP